MDLFLGSAKPPDLKLKANSLSRIIRNEYIEAVIKWLQSENPQQDVLHFHKVHPILLKLFNNNKNQKQTKPENTKNRKDTLKFLLCRQYHSKTNQLKNKL